MSTSKESYKVVLNSQNVTAGPAGNASVTYDFDWTLLPNIPYHVYFSYVGEANDLRADTIASVYADFGVNKTCFQPSEPGVSPMSTFLGTLQPTSLNFINLGALTTTAYLKADFSANPPVYISGRPMLNQFTVTVLNNDYPAASYAPFQGNLGAYVLQLHFVPI